MTMNCTGFKALFLALSLLSVTPGTASAQDSRINPFLPNATSEEEKLLADKERMRQAVREMMPEIRSMLLPSLDEQKKAILTEAVDLVLAKVKEDPSFAAATAAPAGGAGDPSLVDALVGGVPADWKFIACIDGKALYRDAEGIRHTDSEPSDRCAM